MFWNLNVLILLISGELLESVVSVCQWNQKQYFEGEKWNPVLNSVGTNCVECTCVQGSVKCAKTVTCPPVECDNPKIDPRMCCPVCEVISDTTTRGNRSKRNCTYDGKKYLHGDIFPSNSSGIVPTSNKQCVNCACTNGNVLCHLKSCDIPNGCTKLIPEKFDCCPKCADCEAHDGIHRNNTSWHPIVNGSPMPCVTCKCFNGVVDCQKKQCPKLNCKGKTRKRKGECCERCRKKKRKGDKRKKKKEDENTRCKNTKNRKKERRRGKNNRKGNRRKSGNKRKGRPRVNNKGDCLKEDAQDISVVDPGLPVLFPKTNKTQTCVLKNFCLPRKTKYLVYRHLNHDLNIAFFAFDDLKSENVEVWLWKTNHTEDSKSVFKDSISDFQELRYPARWFRQNIVDDALIYGAARNKKLKTFQRRLSRTDRKCRKKNEETGKRCSTKILMQEILCADFEDIVRPKCS